jgi:hypothetical protein
MVMIGQDGRMRSRGPLKVCLEEKTNGPRFRKAFIRGKMPSSVVIAHPVMVMAVRLFWIRIQIRMMRADPHGPGWKFMSLYRLHQDHRRDPSGGKRI